MPPAQDVGRGGEQGGRDGQPPMPASPRSKPSFAVVSGAAAVASGPGGVPRGRGKLVSSGHTTSTGEAASVGEAGRVSGISDPPCARTGPSGIARCCAVLNPVSPRPADVCRRGGQEVWESLGRSDPSRARAGPSGNARRRRRVGHPGRGGRQQCRRHEREHNPLGARDNLERRACPPRSPPLSRPWSRPVVEETIGAGCKPSVSAV